MKQGECNSQHTKIHKNLVKSKESALKKLISQVKEDSDDDNAKIKNNKKENKRLFINSLNNNNFNLSFNNYDKGEENITDNSNININLNTNNINKDMDIDMDNISPREKQQITKREKKEILEKQNINLINFHSGIRRTINEQEYFSNLSYNNKFTKLNFNIGPKETSIMENSDSKDNPYTYKIFNKSKYDLPIEKDNSIKMFWYDAIEESFNKKPSVIFFGKIYEPQSNSFLSISVIIKNIYRTVFILPKPEYKNDEQIQKVYEEFDNLRKKRFNYIKEYQCKYVEKKYCFELPVEFKEVHKVLKVKYKAEYGTIPSNLNQKTFDYIFGKRSSLLENILLKLRIKGPCWLKIKNFTKNKLNLMRTWSDYEISLDNFKNIEVINKNSNGSDIPIPPMKIVSISTQSIRIKNENELYCICCALKEGYQVEDIKGSNKVDDFKSLIIARKIDNKMSIFKNNNSANKNDINVNIDNIPDLNNISKLRELLKVENFYLAKDEKNLLITFITKISAYDPDIIVGHNLNNKHLDLILSRISFYKTPNWTKLSHVQRSTIPNHLRGIYNLDYYRNCFAGRLLCDTFENIKDIFKEANYDLRNICENHLNLKILPEIEPINILSNLSSVNDIKHILQVTMDEAYYTLIVMDKFQILLFTLQLASIAGCLWTKSLQCSKTARCEMLLLHHFYEQNYLLPDKYHRTILNEEDDDIDEMREIENYNSRIQRRKPNYFGDLVLEPQPGFYDDIILVLDFKSLYPSIIQEYNISFETVIRKASQSFIEETNWNYFKMNKDNNNKKEKGNVKAQRIKKDKEEDDEDDEDKVVEIIDKIKFKTPLAVLPLIMKFLVSERRNIKYQLKIEKDKFKKSLLEIKKKSLKISANSLYSYLGYKTSRFYSREISVLIANTARRILRNAAYIIKKCGYKIIYGDTDLVMVNTITQNINKALEIGDKLVKEINKQYKLLIIDIGGFFKSMLLFKKNKYISLKYLPPYIDPNNIEREFKGIDLVLSDWSPLSKKAGLRIFNIFLSGKSKDEIIIAIYDELKKISEDIDNNKIELKDYIITKQLDKNIDDYHDIRALPHVKVAKRLRDQGKINFKIYSFIPYVICFFKEDENDDYLFRKYKTLADKAYHPKEIENDPTLKIDYIWYKENQILPIVKKLVKHIGEISLNQ